MIYLLAFSLNIHTIGCGGGNCSTGVKQYICSEEVSELGIELLFEVEYKVELSVFIPASSEDVFIPLMHISSHLESSCFRQIQL